MTDYVYGPLYPIPNLRRIGASHRAGWALYWAEALGAKIVTSETDVLDIVGKGDRLFVYSGMEWPAYVAGRPFNIPTGTEASMALKAQRLFALANKLKDRLVFIEHDGTDYADILEKRIAYPSFEPHRAKWAGIDFGNARRYLKKTSRWDYPSRDALELIIGDSHAISQFAQPDTLIDRHDGQTLYGMLQRGIDTRIDQFNSTPRLTLYFGNIDIRHHLCRPGATTVKELVAEFERQLTPYCFSNPNSGDRQITVVGPLPINDDKRKIPKTGWYKGAPFYGTWLERTRVQVELANALHKMTKRLGISYGSHTFMFLDSNDQLNPDVMEKPGSVHIRPDCYKYRLDGHSWECLK